MAEGTASYETVHISDGHIFKCADKITEFVDGLPIKFKGKFPFFCPVRPTSWKFRVLFRRDTREEGVDCDVKLLRTDNGQNNLDVEFYMKAFPQSVNISLRPKTLVANDLPWDNIAERTVCDFIPNNVLTQLEDRSLLFRVEFTVRGCHEDSDPQVSGDGSCLQSS